MDWNDLWIIISNKLFLNWLIIIWKKKRVVIKLKGAVVWNKKRVGWKPMWNWNMNWNKSNLNKCNGGINKLFRFLNTETRYLSVNATTQRCSKQKQLDVRNLSNQWRVISNFFAFQVFDLSVFSSLLKNQIFFLCIGPKDMTCYNQGVLLSYLFQTVILIVIWQWNEDFSLKSI